MFYFKYKKSLSFFPFHVLDFWTIDTITVTSSSLPPVKAVYPAALAASAKGLLPVDFPTSCALNAKSSAIS